MYQYFQEMKKWHFCNFHMCFQTLEKLKFILQLHIVNIFQPLNLSFLKNFEIAPNQLIPSPHISKTPTSLDSETSLNKPHIVSRLQSTGFSIRPIIETFQHFISLFVDRKFTYKRIASFIEYFFHNHKVSRCTILYIKKHFMSEQKNTIDVPAMELEVGGGCENE